MTVEFAAQYAYDHGDDPLNYAVFLVQTAIEARDLVVEARSRDPKLCPFYGHDTSDAAVAHRVIGCLLDAGWTPPNTEARSS